MKESLVFVLVILSQIVCTKARFYFNQQQNDDDFVTVIDRRNVAESKSRSKRNSDWLPWRKTPIKNNELGDKNVERSEFILENDSNNIAFVFWKHHKTNVMFILTCQNANTTSFGKLNNKGCHSYGNFYRSENLGGTLNRSDLVEPLKGYWLHCIYLSPVERAFIIMTDYQNKTIFLTSDEGLNYKKVKLTFAPTSIQFHPTNKNVIAAFDDTKKGQQTLWLSQDQGMTWRQVSTNVKNYFWQNEKMARSSDGLYFERLEKNRIINGKKVSSLCYFPFPDKNKVQPILTKITDLIQDSVYVGDEFVLVQKISDRELYVLRPKYDISFNKIQYLFKNAKTHTHHVIISSDNSEILLGVFHPDNTVTLYLSDETGISFAYLQEDIVAEPLKHAGNIPKFDFYRVKGFDNTYIINKQKNGTFISFDKGYSWNVLSYEITGYDGKKVDADCKKMKLKNCHLKLFIRVEEYYSDYTAPLLSKDSAPGIIIAQGRIGGPIERKDMIVNTNHGVYISTDGGKKWRQTLGSYYSYALLDHGNAISATPLQFTVKQGIKISTNYGYHWYDHHLTSHYARVAAIITDSTAKTLVVNVFGFLHQQPQDSPVKGNQWIVWKFNFSSVLPRICKTEDYYRYYPQGRACMLGEKYSYLQNLRHDDKSAKCYSPIDFDLQPQRDPCPCTKADFDCDENYIFVKSQKELYVCKPISDHQKQKQICDKDGYYIKTKGYKKRHGNKCSGGVEKELSGTKTKCDVVLPVAKIKASAVRVGLRDTVQFSIVHSLNTYQTTYVWEFGDGYTLTGNFKEMQNVQHAFAAIGHYTVTLIARNNKGSYTDSSPVIVLDKTFHNSYIDFEAPIIVNQANMFKLKKLTKNGTEVMKRLPNVRFLWSFKGVYIGFYDSVQVPYTFDEAGIFDVEVQVISAVDAQTIVRVIRVYENAYAIDFRFSSYMDRLNTRTTTWLNDFMNKFKRYIEVRYDIDNTNERLIVQANNTLPTTARLIICDAKHNDGRTYKKALQLTTEIIADTNSKKPLFYGYHTSDIHVQNAKLVGPVRHTITDGKGKTTHVKSNAWVYVVVVLFIVFIIIGAAIMIKYRGKRSWFNTRKDKNDIMQKKLVFNTDEDCVGLEGPDLPQFRD